MSVTGRRWAVTIPVILALAVFAHFLRNIDLSAPPRLLPRCGFHVLTGWHCPGCGNTRAAHALLHGDVVGAFRQNVLLVSGLPFLLFWAFRSWMQWVYPHRFRTLPFRWRQSFTYSIVTVVVVFGVIRNIPAPPLSWLAPVEPPAKKSPESEAHAKPPRDAPRPAGR